MRTISISLEWFRKEVLMTSNPTLKEIQMKQLYALIAGIAFAGVAPLALADADPYYLMPEVGGSEITQFVHADDTGINSTTSGDAFWYAGTSGVPSN